VTRLVAAIAIALALPAAAHAQAPDGEGLYAATCLKCHGPGGRGIRDMGPSLRGVGALAADFYIRLGLMPLDHPGEQPHRQRSPFSREEQDALIRYVASLAQGPSVPEPHPERGDLARGLRLFTGHCAGCHQAVAEGGFVTGARVPPIKDDTPVQIAEAVRVGPYLMPRFSTRQLSDAELDSIIRYVEYAKNPDDRGGWGIGHLGPAPEGLVAWLAAAGVLLVLCLVIGERRKRP
jgi:ubiquinol-cytochrome c reductase cytochrome c subunit